MLFKEYHIKQIRDGEKTVTRREWERRQATPGNVYIAATEMFTSHQEADCYILVTDVYDQPLGDMTDEDARKEGDYETLMDFTQGYERVYGEGAWDPDKVVTVVEFEYVGRFPPCPHDDGHAWVSGRASESDGVLQIVSRQCRRCGYEDEVSA